MHLTIRETEIGRNQDAGFLALEYLRQGEASIDQLSDREVDILLFMLRGLTAAEISDKLALAGKTVEHHRQSIRRKMNVATDAQLGVVAARFGFYKPTEVAATAAFPVSALLSRTCARTICPLVGESPRPTSSNRRENGSDPLASPTQT